MADSIVEDKMPRDGLVHDPEHAMRRLCQQRQASINFCQAAEYGICY